MCLAKKLMGSHANQESYRANSSQLQLYIIWLLLLRVGSKKELRSRHYKSDHMHCFTSLLCQPVSGSLSAWCCTISAGFTHVVWKHSLYKTMKYDCAIMDRLYQSLLGMSQSATWYQPEGGETKKSLTLLSSLGQHQIRGSFWKWSKVIQGGAEVI